MANRRTTMDARLRGIANHQDLEAWWYPVWLNQLGVYTDGYQNQDLAIGAQTSLVYQPQTGWTYVYPDFVVFQSRPVNNTNNITRDLKLVMEVKKDQTFDAMADAVTEAEFYMARALNGTNNPNQNNNRMFCVAAAGAVWRWREYRRQGGVWSSPNGWSGDLDTTTSFATQMAL